ncbi:MAG: hypothetical protein KGJ13_08320 [Patescibacteria group bacterium]|nr:hypothetical protein [Patescibacteria group bacterium]
MPDQDLEDWLISTEHLRQRLIDYAKSPIPTDPGARQNDMSTALDMGRDAADLLADAESFLVQSEAQSVILVRREFPDFTAAERKIMIKERTRKIKHLVNVIGAIYRSIDRRRMVEMNLNRSR